MKDTNMISSVDAINDQIDSNPHYPFNLQSGWLPDPSGTAMQKFFANLRDTAPTAWAPSIQAMDELLSSNEVFEYLIDNACEENAIIWETHIGGVVDITKPNDGSQVPGSSLVPVPRIKNKDELLNFFNSQLDKAPTFIDDELVGLPFSAIVVGIDPTLSGRTLFRLPMFNQKMGDVLNHWNKYLASEDSNWIFGEEGKQWLSPKAKQHYQFEMWKKDNETVPYWNSWNSFFTRQFKEPKISRPVADPDSNQIVTSANDGSLFRWDENIAKRDVFWFKDMAYSLGDILSSDDPTQQKVIDDHNLVELFTDGSIFQTYLNPYNFHRWWCPANGDVLFDPIVIAGCFFNKLIIPDFAGASTASLPYLAEVNARGLMVIKTKDYGYIACIPLGMSEVSTVTFDGAMKANAQVHKGQEMGMFEYGGSSYAIIFQKLPGKRLIFQNAAGDVYQKQPLLPKGSANVGGTITNIGMQIGKWQTVDFNVDSTKPWQTPGYVNEGEICGIKWTGGTWTANPAINDGNLYPPSGSSVKATSGYPLVGAPEGALIGRVGTNSPFLIGESATTPAGQAGLLQVVINDDLSGQYGAGLTDNEGAIAISLSSSSS